MEMMEYGNMDFMFVKQELSDLKASEHDNTESRIIQNSHDALREHENCSYLSENVSFMFGVNTKDSLTDTKCQLHINFGKKILNKAYISDICSSAVSAVSILNRQEKEYSEEKPHKCDCHSPDT
ncbi:hypothetical protein BsWGS_22388 [Bradybaena similaris]